MFSVSQFKLVDKESKIIVDISKVVAFTNLNFRPSIRYRFSSLSKTIPKKNKLCFNKNKNF